MVTVCILTSDPGWQLPPAIAYEPEWIEGGRRTMHELAVAIAATGREVEFRGEVTPSVMEELCETAGVRVALPTEPRELTASDTLIINEGVVIHRIYARLALSPARLVLMVLAPLGMFGWPFTPEPWSPPDVETAAIDSFGRPEHYLGAAALGFELWTHSHGMQEGAARGGAQCRFIGSGNPAPFPTPAATRDIDVLTLSDNRWSRSASTVKDELARLGVACVAAPSTNRAHVLELLGRSRAFVHPIRVEGNSRLGCEARGMGAVPVVLDSNPYGTGMNEAGGALAVGSVEEMPEAVAALLADAGRLGPLSAAGMASAADQIAWPRYLERIEEALAAEIGDPGRPARAGLGSALRDDLRTTHQLEAELAAAQLDLDRHRGWLEATNASLSWRMTAPLRSAKRLLSSRRKR